MKTSNYLTLVIGVIMLVIASYGCNDGIVKETTNVTPTAPINITTENVSRLDYIPNATERGNMYVLLTYKVSPVKDVKLVYFDYKQITLFTGDFNESTKMFPTKTYVPLETRANLVPAEVMYQNDSLKIYWENPSYPKVQPAFANRGK